MSNNTVVVFTANNARILRNPENLSVYRGMSNAVINPDLLDVMRIPPHLWKLVDGKVVAMEESEAKAREAHIEQVGAVNEIALPKLPSILFRIMSIAARVMPYILCGVIGAALMHFIGKYR